VIANDHTVKHGAQIIDIPPQPDRMSFAKVEVELREYFDGRLQVHYQGRCLAKTLVNRPKTNYRVTNNGHSQARSHDPMPIADPVPSVPRPKWRPPDNHPWKRIPLTPPK
jgi:hypothetical protein